MSHDGTDGKDTNLSPIDALAAALREEAERKAAQAAEREATKEERKERAMLYKQRGALLSQSGTLASLKNLLRLSGRMAAQHDEAIMLWLETTPLRAYAYADDCDTSYAAALSLGDENGTDPKRIEAMLCGIDDEAPPTFVMSGYVK